MKNSIPLITLAFLTAACSTERSRCYDKCVKAKSKQHKHIGGAGSSHRNGCWQKCSKK